MSDGLDSQYQPGPFGHQFIQLVLARVREFTREPEAVFWALFFPLLLAGGLGIAFRGGPVQTPTADAETDNRRFRTPSIRVNEPPEPKSLTGGSSKRQ